MDPPGRIRSLFWTITHPLSGPARDRRASACFEREGAALSPSRTSRSACRLQSPSFAIAGSPILGPLALMSLSVQFRSSSRTHVRQPRADARASPAWNIAPGGHFMTKPARSSPTRPLAVSAIPQCRGSACRYGSKKRRNQRSARSGIVTHANFSPSDMGRSKITPCQSRSPIPFRLHSLSCSHFSTREKPGKRVDR